MIYPWITFICMLTAVGMNAWAIKHRPDDYAGLRLYKLGMSAMWTLYYGLAATNNTFDWGRDFNRVMQAIAAITIYGLPSLVPRHSPSKEEP